MNNLLYKEFRLTIGWFFYVFPILLGALMFIPQWLFFFVPLYFCFVTVPNLFGLVKAQNDVTYSVMLPVSKRNIVLSRIISISTLELLHIACTAVFAIIRNTLYGVNNFFMDPNYSFIGLVFIMFGLFNIIMFPIYYKTAYKYGLATVLSTLAAVLFAAGVEFLVIFNKKVAVFLEADLGRQLLLLGGGIILFVALTAIAYKISEKRFEEVDV
ncbi:MAG: ABC-2 transporter permease [Clostridia bacterium]|nr:ABC-2 transporter permease [Clostridia bacterium]